MATVAADMLAHALQERQDAAIAVPTGQTPLPLFAELIARVERGTLDLSRADWFCLDEYVNVSPGDPVSLTGWLLHHFFEPARIPTARIHPLPAIAADHEAACAVFEAALAERGGLDLAVVGLGGNGHVAYNEPGATADSRTRVVTLTNESVTGAAAYFAGQRVPARAVTIGIATLLEARQIVLIVTGRAKAEILRRALYEPPSASIPASWLRLAGDRLTVIADDLAVSACEALPWRHARSGEDL
jgi:glucosamine-6-phosphate deaminase